MSNAEKIYATSHVAMRSVAYRHLAISPVVAQAYLEHLGCPKLPNGRVDMADLWCRMWGIDRVPSDMITAMSAPLLSVDDVARMINVTPHTIRNAGNSRNPDWNLPIHVDIGPRIRRYLPLHITAWMNGRPVATWLEKRHGPKGPLGLSLRHERQKFLGQYDSTANACKSNEKYDEGSYPFGSGNNTGLRILPKNSETNRK
ncbi:hypothetical protein FBT96_13155 [Rhodobacter capsulatus]|uniref:Uncharacterized protein n=1 Tax=Rhodobacter capsulatus TaxID=1061 RepID=A0A4U1JPF1_RHOCA|nr:hypothetical protein [Rhodobacter capsulatus]TKD17655.1 hypothetical protein FBT96_13155 [Rhodobacter capsulatus]